MRTKSHVLVAWLAALTMLAAVGCGSSNETAEPTTAAIEGPGGRQDRPSTGLSNPTTQHPRRVADPMHPVVAIETSMGTITVKLDAEHARLTVANFLTYADEGFFDRTIFHQVNRDYAVVGGTFNVEMTEKKTHTPIFNEAHNGLKNRRGTIAMARQADVIDSATSQFYFNLADNPELDHKNRTTDGYGYCVFGEVIEGLDVLDRIGNVKVHDAELPNGDRLQQVPVQTVLIKSVRQVR